MYNTVPFFWELHMLLLLLLLLITRCGACVIARGNNKKAVFLTGLSEIQAYPLINAMLGKEYNNS